jgi:hypothetical protein
MEAGVIAEGMAGVVPPTGCDPQGEEAFWREGFPVLAGILAGGVSDLTPALSLPTLKM